MAVVKRKVAGVKAVPVKASAAKLNLSLAGARSVPKESLLEYSWLIYGAKKIGKTSLASKFPQTHFLMGEPGGRALRIFQRPVNSWPEFVGYLDLLLNEKHEFKTVVVDTIDAIYDRCFEFMCQRLGIEHPTDENDYGKSWGQIENEFTLQINRLLQSKLGCVFISHSKMMEVETPTGRKFKTIVPTMPNQALKFMTAVIDIWACYQYDGSDRRLVIRGDDFIGAGCRLEENFLTPSGVPVREIPMGSSSTEAYQNLVKAFNNKQVKPGLEEAEEVEEVEVEEEEEETVPASKLKLKLKR